MDSWEEALRAELLKRMSGEALEQKIREKEEQFHGLLTREAALFSISKELNVDPPEKPMKLSEISPTVKRASVLVRINRIFETRRFERNGKEGKVCRVLVGDSTGERSLVLWNDDVNYVEQGKILKDDLVEIAGVYMKNDELHLGYRGQVTLMERKPEKRIKELADAEFADLTVQLIEAGAIKKYERDGAMREMFSCTVDDGSAPARLLLWEPNAHSLEGARLGDSVRLEGVRFRNGELHAGRYSKVILIRKPISPGQLTVDFEGDLEGKIKNMEVSGDGLLLGVEDGGDSSVFLPNHLAMRLLGLKSLPDDIKLETMLKLKGTGVMGKTLKARGKSSAVDGRIRFTVERLLG